MNLTVWILPCQPPLIHVIVQVLFPLALMMNTNIIKRVHKTCRITNANTNFYIRDAMVHIRKKKNVASWEVSERQKRAPLSTQSLLLKEYNINLFQLIKIHAYPQRSWGIPRQEMHIYLFELISSLTDIRDVVRPTVAVVLQDFPLWFEKRDGNCIFSVEGLDFRKYLQGKQKLNTTQKNPKKPKSQTKSTSQFEHLKRKKIQILLLPSRPPKVSDLYA